MNTVHDLLLGQFSDHHVTSISGQLSIVAETAEDVVSAFSLARGNSLRIQPLGGGRNTDAGKPPENVFGLSSVRLDGIVDYSPGGLFITVESGVHVNEIANMIKSEKLFFPFANAGYDGSIGSAVSLGLSLVKGPEEIPIKRWVPSLKCVLPSGKHVKLGAVTLKSVAGYDVTKLITGSRGRLAYITQVTIRLANVSRANEFADALLSPIEPSHPVWDSISGNYSKVERNLKTELDPDSILPF